MTNRSLADAQVRRTLVCLRALERFDTASIEAGALQRLIDAGLRMTSACELVFAWTARGKLPQGVVARLDGACREFLAARAELIEAEAFKATLRIP